MTIPLCIRWLAPYTKKIEKRVEVISTLIVLKLKNSEAQQWGNTMPGAMAEYGKEY